MGIVFQCDHCGRTLNVKDFLAGKRGICPKCGGRIEIPGPAAESGSSNAAAVTSDANSAQPEFVSQGAAPTAVSVASMIDPIAESPQSKWFVLPAGSKKNYGPALGDAMRQWIREGRVGADALVWREGWSEWRKAVAAFPQLAATGPSAVSVVVAVPAIAAPTLAATTNGSLANSIASFELPAGLEIVPGTAPRISSTAPSGPADRTSLVRRRSNTARNVTLVVLVLAVVALVPALVWVIAHQ